MGRPKLLNVFIPTPDETLYTKTPSYVTVVKENTNLVVQETVTNVQKGSSIVFSAPCDHEGIVGIKINNIVYEILDASGKSPKKAFVKGVLVSLKIDSDNRKVYIQNPISSGEETEACNVYGIGRYFTEQVKLADIPCTFYEGCSAVLNNEIHVMVGSNHYKYTTSSNTWTKVSTLPNEYFYDSRAVALNNEIHVLGGISLNSSTSGNTNHYKWNGSTWTLVSTLPYKFFFGDVVVYKNEIHMLGGGNDSVATLQYHYKYSGSTWTKVSTLPFNFYNGKAVVYNDEIHILETTKHYKYNGSSWTSVSTLPYNFTKGSAVAYNDEIYIIGGYYFRENNIKAEYHAYDFTRKSWLLESKLPYRFYDGCAVVANNKLHLLGGMGGYNNHYILATEIRDNL